MHSPTLSSLPADTHCSLCVSQRDSASWRCRQRRENLSSRNLSHTSWTRPESRRESMSSSPGLGGGGEFSQLYNMRGFVYTHLCSVSNLRYRDSMGVDSGRSFSRMRVHALRGAGPFLALCWARHNSWIRDKRSRSWIEKVQLSIWNRTFCMRDYNIVPLVI